MVRRMKEVVAIPATELLIDLRAAAALIGMSYGTVYRYATVGFHGDQLETVNIGRSIRTTSEAITRFVARTTQATRAAKERARANRDVLDVLGIAETPRGKR